LLKAPKPRKGGDWADQELESGASGGAESPPKPGLIKGLLDNGTTACNGGGWQVSEASQASHTEASNGGGAINDEADKHRRVVNSKKMQLQAVLTKSLRDDVGVDRANKDFAEARAEIVSLLGQSEAVSIISEVIKEQAAIEQTQGKELKAKLALEKACPGKRAKGKASQRKGYG
jgi:hypothetical protein